jgi:hypothetical protein
LVPEGTNPLSKKNLRTQTSLYAIKDFDPISTIFSASLILDLIPIFSAY